MVKLLRGLKKLVTIIKNGIDILEISPEEYQNF